MGSSYAASAVLLLPATLEGGSYPDVTVQYGSAGIPGTPAEIGTLEFLFGNGGAGGNSIAITSATLASTVYRTSADKREWTAFGFDTNAFNVNIPGSFWEASAVDAPTLSGSVSGATNASPIVITATAHSMGAVGTILPVTITSVGGNTAANAFWWAKVTDANHFQLLTSTGNGSYTSGGTWQTNMTAGEMFMVHSSDYKGATPYGGYKIIYHAVDGTLNINNRVGQAVITIPADGSTLALTPGSGGITSTRTISFTGGMETNSTACIILGAGDNDPAHPKLKFTSSAQSAGIFTSTGATFGISTNGAQAALWDTSGNLANTGTISSGSQITGHALNAITSGNASLVLQCTGVGGDHKVIIEHTTDDTVRFNVNDGLGYSAVLVCEISSKDIVAGAGFLRCDTIGKTLKIKSGTNGKSGTLTLASGLATVANTSWTGNSVFHCSLKGAVIGTKAGDPVVTSSIIGTSFSVTGALTDNSVYNWWISEVN